RSNNESLTATRRGVFASHAPLRIAVKQSQHSHPNNRYFRLRPAAEEEILRFGCQDLFTESAAACDSVCMFVYRGRTHGPNSDRRLSTSSCSTAGGQRRPCLRRSAL